LNSMKLRSERKKKTEKSSLRSIAIKEKFYKSNFYIFEIGFIIVAVPVLLVAITSIPILVYFTLVQNFELWPFIILGSLIAFSQILAIQIFVKKFYLTPYNMTFGEYLRFRYDERNVIEKDENKPQKTWYDNLDEFIIQIRDTQREQTHRIYATNYENANLSM
ncbi:MAG: hypothetical protein KAX09_10210, partial [Candidatus Heimdallarchaeota archaeon]|nr:hypothetical protein [Candidatus Heimdallarchaeota archaeon]